MIKIGQGIDIHNLIRKQTHQKLGGVCFLLDYKIEAHSDGDIILHSISSAIAGALALKDLGSYFPDNKKETKNMDSLMILDFYLNLMKKEKYFISNLDITIICEKIIFKDLKDEIVLFLSEKLKTKNISLKATRYEKDCNQIQCNSIILLQKN